MKNINNKLVAVTGAGGVLCGTIARSLAEKGFKVIEYDASIDKCPYKHPNISFHKNIRLPYPACSIYRSFPQFALFSGHSGIPGGYFLPMLE